jgi:hypothetical protein
VGDESIDDTTEVSEVGGLDACEPYGGEKERALVLIWNTNPNAV